MNKHRTAAQPVIHAVAAINVLAFSIAIVLLVYYVVTANGVAAQTWRYADAQKTMHTLTEMRTALFARQAAFEDREDLSRLAVGAGFVPAGSVEHIIQPVPVAAR